MNREELESKINWAGDDAVWRGADIGPGWFDLVAQLADDLAELSCHSAAVQVKEKFGGLRFYVDVRHDNSCPSLYPDTSVMECPTYKRIVSAERESYDTCEMCSSPGEIRTGGWLRVLCDSCHASKRSRWSDEINLE